MLKIRNEFIKKCIINLLKQCRIEKHAEKLMRRKNWQIKMKFEINFYQSSKI